MKDFYKWLERKIGTLKFAVIIISLFTVAMIVGTFLESYYGTEFASRVIYKTYWFMGIQFFMFLSIVFATTLRLPPKKRLYGFYVIHSGLIIIGIGALVTYTSGIDGMIFLPPNEPSRYVNLNNDILKITYPTEGKEYTLNLPYTAFKTSVDQSLDGMDFKDYYPFASTELEWIPSKINHTADKTLQSTRYFFKNAFAEDDFTLSLHPEADQNFKASFTMGPLTISYLPLSIAECFGRQNASGLIFWNTETSECFTPEERSIPVKKTSSGTRFIVLSFAGEFLSYFPDFSPFPLAKDLKTTKYSPVKIFSKKIFEERPSLFLFGTKASFYDKTKKVWELMDFPKEQKSIVLPWMNAQISIIRHEEKLVPSNTPKSVIPIQKDGSLIYGDLRALKVSIDGSDYWLTSDTPLELIVRERKVKMEITKDSVKLPFELTLTKFKMDTDPGTMNPASYESFVKLFTGEKNSEHHIYMNNPLKFQGFTFYQASYSKDEQDVYSSTLSVNVDPGRPLKYLGSLMLIIGSIWHYNLNKKKTKKE